MVENHIREHKMLLVRVTNVNACLERLETNSFSVVVANPELAVSSISQVLKADEYEPSRHAADFVFRLLRGFSLVCRHMPIRKGHPLLEAIQVAQQVSIATLGEVHIALEEDPAY